jgi:hypothetical protein
MIYRDILAIDEGGKNTFGREMLEYIEKDPDMKSLDLFDSQFRELVGLIEGNGPRKLIDNAKTNVFTQKTLLSKVPRVSLGIVYSTGFVYCFARLTILGLAFSSLRSMPEDVYTTTLASVIPALG